MEVIKQKLYAVVEDFDLLSRALSKATEQASQLEAELHQRNKQLRKTQSQLELANKKLEKANEQLQECKEDLRKKFYRMDKLEFVISSLAADREARLKSYEEEKTLLRGKITRLARELEVAKIPALS